MLSKDSVKLLKWMNENDDWAYDYQLQKKYPILEYRNLEALKDNGVIDVFTDENEGPDINEYGEACYPEQYRINDKGKAYLELMAGSRWKEFRNWASFFIAVVAFIKSFFF